jgi:putative salt-induced outer membrane protein YdiY
MILVAHPVSAQAAPPAPAAPPPPWAGNVSAGVTLTSGNTDSKQYNVGFEVDAHPDPVDTARLDGLLLRATSAGELTVSRTNLDAREEHRLGDRVFVFGQLGYLHDPFKKIDYLVAPVGGLGYQIYKTTLVSFAADAGAGGVWEKNPGSSVDASGAVTAGESLTWKFSGTATLTHSARGLWKTDDLSDALYTVEASLVASLVGNSQLKVDVLDTYKHVVPDVLTKKNDVALVFAVAYKF